MAAAVAVFSSASKQQLLVGTLVDANRLTVPAAKWRIGLYSVRLAAETAWITTTRSGRPRNSCLFIFVSQCSSDSVELTR